MRPITAVYCLLMFTEINVNHKHSYNIGNYSNVELNLLSCGGGNVTGFFLRLRK